MSSIGKIFVVVNLVLALLLLGSLGALLNASRATKTEVASLEKQVAELESHKTQSSSDFASQKRALDSEKRALESGKQDLEVERDNAMRSAAKESVDNQQLRDDVSKLSVNYELLQSDLSAAQQRNTDLQDSNDQYRDQAQAAQNDARESLLARRDLTDQIASREVSIETLNMELTVAMDRARQAERLVDYAKTAGFDPTTLIATPAIDALVASVDTEYGFVILDKGSSDDVEKGFTFDVYRGPDYLGQVRVDTVNDNYSTARIMLSNGTMRAHDRATTRL
jgi:cell division protein FtsL